MRRNCYILDITNKYFLGKSKYNASGKPRTDSLKTMVNYGGILKQLNVAPLRLPDNKLCVKINRRLDWAYILLMFFIKYRGINNSIILLQYPFLSLKPSLVCRLINYLKSKSNKLVTLVHDLEFLRSGSNFEMDKFILENSDVVIIHSQKMLNAIESDGIRINNYVCLEFFDYLSKLDLPTETNLRDIEVIYAGNLLKSKFLSKISKVPFNENFKLNLYGTYCDFLKETEFVRYMGRFDAEDFSSIQGNWGLVWDGPSVETCEEKVGEYLKYNAPFKMSLYLAAKRPVIVWEHSAMADYVKKYNIGICIPSLKDISTQIDNLSDTDLQTIQANVNRVSLEVRAGEKLKMALEKSLKIIQNNNV